jgi:hypothetical protein
MDCPYLRDHESRMGMSKATMGVLLRKAEACGRLG